MGEATFTFRVEEELKASFAELARAQDRSAAQLLRVMMREAVARQRDAAAHDAWFRSEIEQAMREADDPATPRIGHDRVESNWRHQRETLIKRAEA